MYTEYQAYWQLYLRTIFMLKLNKKNRSNIIHLLFRDYIHYVLSRFSSEIASIILTI